MRIDRGLGLLATLTCAGTAAADIATALRSGSVNGNIRAHYHTMDYDTRTDERAFALGGALRAETGAIGWARVGVGFYTAQDLDTNSSDPAKVNGRLGSDIEVLGEAYLSLTQWSSSIAVGRQKFDTPFANPSDAFIIPLLYEGVSLRSDAISGLTVQIDYINTIKNRNSDEFIDVGAFSTSRFGVARVGTSGTLIVGGTYKAGGVDLQGWYYRFDDLFNMGYVQGGYTLDLGDGIKSFFALQAGTQSDTGDALLGKVDAQLYGVQIGASFGAASVALAHNRVAEEEDSFRNGAFLAPYSFSTSPIFTNSMVETMENVDAGDATKLTLGYNFARFSLKLSHAWLDFKNSVDREATDFDLTYSLDNYVKGLSLRWRVEVVSADADSAQLTNHRLQAQYLF